MQNINLSPDWFHDDYKLQVASLFNCCYVWYVVYDCKRSKKDMAECPRRQNRTTLLGTNHCFRPPEADVPSEFSAENNNWLFLGRNLSIPMYKKTETDYRIEDGGR